MITLVIYSSNFWIKTSQRFTHSSWHLVETWLDQRSCCRYNQAIRLLHDAQPTRIPNHWIKQRRLLHLQFLDHVQSKWDPRPAPMVAQHAACRRTEPRASAHLGAYSIWRRSLLLFLVEGISTHHRSIPQHHRRSLQRPLTSCWIWSHLRQFNGSARHQRCLECWVGCHIH